MHARQLGIAEQREQLEGLVEESTYFPTGHEQRELFTKNPLLALHVEQLKAEIQARHPGISKEHRLQIVPIL